ncbi:hypothetical protein PHYSODRAFT_319330 [Phytophthora sojae]|uniref:DDE Tnp4 domain-containing protein n=1 Tax=Phytophthora sojae (strain P6497) TaxID=1094619 RepID=G5AA68_PHYSP|nr:hypothetical protein PHYSODRAFT_319330 [Phytophthora sojae]EGZ07497.1 hypothetical protein PHYSODRAFT_319330 [Phytophthora sojae]|eukprot:XP_009537063.1 hypothetical protein PHYSODRAFT_319330 [Phytophthora sojae]
MYQDMCLWLVGYSYHPVRMLSGVSTSAVYADVHALRFPISEQEQRHSAREFARLSNDGIMRGCVGAIDGWLCPIQVPRRREVRIVASFFSGHYPRYGINVRPRVDYHCRFTAISSSSPGGMGDYIAYLHWKLSQLADTFPKGLHLVGDNAYSNSNTLLTPLRRPHTTIASRDSSNFLLSQLRIRVEMAFGLLVNKWRIFKSPLRVGMKHMGKVIHVACILHHWCINERLANHVVFEFQTLAGIAFQASNNCSRVCFTIFEGFNPARRPSAL